MDNLIFQTLVGSHSHGTNIETSDLDYKGVYVLPNDKILGFGYIEQIDIGKDETYFEIRRFIELLMKANPTVLEMLFAPHDCIVLQNEIFNPVLLNRNIFLTKQCLNSFGGMAVEQIRKARGQDKMMNWEKHRIERKTPLDFVYAYDNGKTIPINKWLKDRKWKQELCGLVALDHLKDAYALYYDISHHYGSQTNTPNYYESLGFKGLVVEDSNDLRLSSIPKGLDAVTVIGFNKDAYSVHCREFRKYKKWVEDRNEDRFVEVKNRGQRINGKNLLHCRRILDMALELAETGTLSVRRKNREDLLKIRRGEIPLQPIVDQAEIDIKRLDELFAKSSLPDYADRDKANELLLDIRHGRIS